MGRPASHEIPRVSCYSGTPLNAYFTFRIRDFHPLWSDFPDSSARLFQLKAPATPGRTPVWASPLSLAATDGINVFFFSCGYLDVSVPHVRSNSPMNSVSSNWELPQLSFLIRTSPDQRSFASFPELIAGYHVLHRLSMPRHPPYTLSSLITFIDHRQKKLIIEPSDHLTIGQNPITRSSDRQITRSFVHRARWDALMLLYKPTPTEPITNQNRQKGARRILPDRKTKMGRTRSFSLSPKPGWGA